MKLGWGILMPRKKSAPPDFEVTFTDGEVMTHREGITWDDVPRGRAVDGVKVAGVALFGFDRYSFAWEGVASTHGNDDPRVAVIGVGVKGEKATVVRVPKSGEPTHIDIPASSVPFVESAYRP